MSTGVGFSLSMNMIQNAVLEHSNLLDPNHSKDAYTEDLRKKDLKYNLMKLSQEERKDLSHLIRKNHNINNWKISKESSKSKKNTIDYQTSETSVLSKLEREANLYKKVFTRQKTQAEECLPKSLRDRATHRFMTFYAKWVDFFEGVFGGISTKQLIGEMQNLISSTDSNRSYGLVEIQQQANAYVDDLYQKEERKIYAALSFYDNPEVLANDGYKQWITDALSYLDTLGSDKNSAREKSDKEVVLYFKSMRKKIKSDFENSRIDSKIGARLLLELNKSIKILEDINLSKFTTDTEYKNRCVEKLKSCRFNMNQLIQEIDVYIGNLKKYEQKLREEQRIGYDLYVKAYSEGKAISCDQVVSAFCQGPSYVERIQKQKISLLMEESV